MRFVAIRSNHINLLLFRIKAVYIADAVAAAVGVEPTVINSHAAYRTELLAVDVVTTTHVSTRAMSKACYDRIAYHVRVTLVQDQM